MPTKTVRYTRDFPRVNLGQKSAPIFPKQRQKFQNLINLPMSDFMLHFGKKFMKIAPKITNLRLITFRFVVDFDQIFLETKFKIFLLF